MIIADFYNVEFSKLFSNDRKADLVKVRNLTMYIARLHFQKTTLAEIAGFFNRDHCTAIHAIKYVNDYLATDKKFRKEYTQIRWLCTRAGFTALKPRSRKYCNRIPIEIKIINSTSLLTQEKLNAIK